MQKLRKRLELHESGNGSGNGNGGGGNGGVASGRSSQSVTPHDTLSQGSRASSNASLNNIEYQSTNGSSPQSQVGYIFLSMAVDRCHVHYNFGLFIVLTQLNPQMFSHP